MNPFELTFDALWSLGEASVPLKELVKIGNRIKFNTNNSDPVKQNVQTADLPELILVSQGGTPNLHATSCTSEMIRRYAWLVSTGDLRINHLSNPLGWAIFCAMTNWKIHLASLEWQNKRFIKAANLTDVTEGDSDPERNRGIKGWSALWVCEIRMVFTTTDLKVYNSGS